MLEVKNVSHCYKLENKTTTEILTDIDFTLSDNHLYFIVGKSGCGKTTLLNIMEGILKPTSGQILFDGQDIYDKKFDFNSHIGILFQNYNLIDGITVYENLKICADLKNVPYEVIDQKLKEFNLEDLRDYNVDLLSGGEKQRVAFIRAILNDPEIVFCDEPTGAIDDDNALLLMKNLRDLSKKALVIIVTHNLDLINYDENMIVIKKGKATIKSRPVEKNPAKPHYFSKNTKHRNTYVKILIKRLLNKTKFKHILYCISICITTIFACSTVELILGMHDLKGSLEFSYLNNNKFTISKKEKTIETDSLISIVKEIRPTKDEVYNFLPIAEKGEVYNNYSYFLNGNNLIYAGINQVKNVKVELSANLDGKIAVNNLFMQKIKNKKEKISLELRQNYTYNYIFDENTTRTYNEEFYYHKIFTIDKVINEFKYMNNPTIFIPMNEFELFLNENYLTNVLKTEKKQVSWKEVVDNAIDDDPICSFSYDVYLKDKKQILDTFSYIDRLGDKGDFKLLNEPHFYTESFLDITVFLGRGLMIFAFLSMMTTMSLQFFIQMSMYLGERKQMAILATLGSSSSEMRYVYSSLTHMETFTSMMFGILISLGIAEIVNHICYKKLAIKYLFESLYMPNRAALIFTILGLILLLTICVGIVNYIAIRKSRAKDIAKELREE